VIDEVIFAVDSRRLAGLEDIFLLCDEEGVRFHTTYLGSKVVAGHFDNNLLVKEDAAGITLQQVIQAMGGNTALLQQDAIPAEGWLGYFEIHIEQGPVLYERNIPVGIVTAIAGQKRIAVTFTGEAGHAGTVPMHMRSDALCAASEFILEAERFAANPVNRVVATIGTLNITHAASNVIPGEVSCTLDLRSDDQSVLSTCYTKLEQLGRTVCERRNIAFDWKPVQESNPVTCDVAMNHLLAQSLIFLFLV
jgi:hydantoinase/carbamoylase family amidase